jgi:hypothetical protein
MTRVATTRFVAYRTGRTTAIRSTRPRRTQRSMKVWAFQVKKATGRTVVSSSRLPSTRQYTGLAGFGLWFELSKFATVDATHGSPGVLGDESSIVNNRGLMA